MFLLGSLLFEMATGVALTSMVTGDPAAVIRGRAALSQADRDHDWQASIPKLREAARPAMESFALAVPAAIRDRSVRLLEQLTDPDPAGRLRAARGGPSLDGWNLQWLLDRIDGLRRAIDPTVRKQYLASRPVVKHGRPRSRKTRK